MPTKLIVDCSTGQTTEVELTAEEIAQMKLDTERFEAKQAEADAKEAQRQAILDRIGLTSDELKTILG